MLATLVGDLGVVDCSFVALALDRAGVTKQLYPSQATGELEYSSRGQVQLLKRGTADASWSALTRIIVLDVVVALRVTGEVDPLRCHVVLRWYCRKR